MQATDKKKTLTFGAFIVSVYDAYGRRKAAGFVRLAINARLVEFRGKRRLVIS